MVNCMRVTATADLHGSLPTIKPCDILLLGGDITPVENHDIDYQAEWLDTTFRQWLERLRNSGVENIVGIAGNHDYVFERPSLVPDLPWTYLEDSSVDINGLHIFGTPWVPNLRGWAFYGGEGGCGIYKAGRFPENIDILLAHGPMRGFGDHVSPRFGDADVGCLYMRERVRTIQPKMFVCGHIHEGYGWYRHPYIEYGVYNVSHMTENYRPLNAPVELADFLDAVDYGSAA